MRIHPRDFKKVSNALEIERDSFVDKYYKSYHEGIAQVCDTCKYEKDDNCRTRLNCKGFNKWEEK